VATSQTGSIELVAEFFEVRAQVDRDLTTMSRVDRRLGLIKNLGRHSYAPLATTATRASYAIYLKYRLGKKQNHRECT
jgi:hypothetical protein